MKRKKVWRYYCDFCKKANCSKPSIEKHEERCTMNPKRYCGCCGLLGNSQGDINTLKEELWKDVNGYLQTNPAFELGYVVPPDGGILIERLRKKTENCPACIMATIRQSNAELKKVGIDGFMFDFNFQEELKSFMADVNEAQRKDGYY